MRGNRGKKKILSLKVEDITDRIGTPLKMAGMIIMVFVVLSIMNPFVVAGTGERGMVLNFGVVQWQVLG